MLATIKTYALAALGVIAAVFSALFYREKAKYEESLRKGINEAREIEHKAQDQLNEDLKMEAENRENANHSKRDDFS